MQIKNILLKFFLTLSPVFRFKIAGNSMKPTLQPGDIVIVSKIPYWFKHPAVNDIVAVHDPRDNKILIKRVTRTKNGHYFVEGDNKAYSTDSREFGMVEKGMVVGKVVYVVNM